MLRRLFGPEPKIVEYLLGWMAITWGLWLCNPRIDFSRNAYQVLAVLAPQMVWGLMIAALGAFMLYAIYSGKRRCRKYALFSLFVIWSIIAFGLGLANIYSTALTTYFWIAAIHGALWLRMAGMENG